MCNKLLTELKELNKHFHASTDWHKEELL